MSEELVVDTSKHRTKVCFIIIIVGARYSVTLGIMQALTVYVFLEYIATKSRRKILTESEEKAAENSLRNKFFAGLFAVLAMTGYAVSNQLFQVRLT
jgi:hypothetical protein